MLTKFAGIDFGKWTLTTSSGFVVTAAVIFIIDALSPGRLTESIFIADSAGNIVVYGFVAVVISSVLGLLIDSIFHTFGRWYAKKFWGPLGYAIKFRNFLMLEIGLTELDFDWIFASNNEKFTADVEKDYLRFTEVAGSVGYTMMLLLGPAIYMLLHLEYDRSWLISFLSAIFVILGGYILLLTSAASIYKYETRTTAYTMDDIRKLCPSLNVKKVDSQCEGAGCSRKKWQPKKLAWSLIILAVSVGILGLSHLA